MGNLFVVVVLRFSCHGVILYRRYQINFINKTISSSFFGISLRSILHKNQKIGKLAQTVEECNNFPPYIKKQSKKQSLVKLQRDNIEGDQKMIRQQLEIISSSDDSDNETWQLPDHNIRYKTHSINEIRGRRGATITIDEAQPNPEPFTTIHAVSESLIRNGQENISNQKDNAMIDRNMELHHKQLMGKQLNNNQWEIEYNRENLYVGHLRKLFQQNIGQIQQESIPQSEFTSQEQQQSQNNDEKQPEFINEHVHHREVSAIQNNDEMQNQQISQVISEDQVLKQLGAVEVRKFVQNFPPLYHIVPEQYNIQVQPAQNNQNKLSIQAAVQPPWVQPSPQPQSQSQPKSQPQPQPSLQPQPQPEQQQPSPLPQPQPQPQYQFNASYKSASKQPQIAFQPIREMQGYPAEQQQSQNEIINQQQIQQDNKPYNIINLTELANRDGNFIAQQFCVQIVQQKCDRSLADLQSPNYGHLENKDQIDIREFLIQPLAPSAARKQCNQPILQNIGVPQETISKQINQPLQLKNQNLLNKQVNPAILQKQSSQEKQCINQIVNKQSSSQAQAFDIQVQPVSSHINQQFPQTLTVVQCHEPISLNFMHDDPPPARITLPKPHPQNLSDIIFQFKCNLKKPAVPPQPKKSRKKIRLPDRLRPPSDKKKQIQSKKQYKAARKSTFPYMSHLTTNLKMTPNIIVIDDDDDFSAADSSLIEVSNAYSKSDSRHKDKDEREEGEISNSNSSREDKNIKKCTAKVQTIGNKFDNFLKKKTKEDQHDKQKEKESDKKNLKIEKSMKVIITNNYQSTVKEKGNQQRQKR